MTDRIKGLVVTLDYDYREDDIEPVMAAIRLIEGVADVQASVAGIEDIMNRARIRRELETKLIKALAEDA